MGATSFAVATSRAATSPVRPVRLGGRRRRRRRGEVCEPRADEDDESSDELAQPLSLDGSAVRDDGGVDRAEAGGGELLERAIELAGA